MQKYFKNIAKLRIETLEYIGVIVIVAIVDAWIVVSTAHDPLWHPDSF